MMTSQTSVRLIDEICGEFLVCGICNQHFTTPRSLKCQHTFCEECLEIRYAIEEQERPHRFLLSRSLSCPLCFVKTDLPPGGVRRLPLNTVVTKLADVVERPKLNGNKQSCDICKQAGSHREVAASVKCLECSKTLCANCATLHQQTKVTQDHSLFNVEAENDLECRSHPDEPVRFYCEDCQACICILCTFQDHVDHSIFSFQEAHQRYTEEASRSIQACRQMAERIGQSLEMVKRAELGMRQARDRIQDVTTETIMSLRRRERQLDAELRGIYGEEAIKHMADCSRDFPEKLRSLEQTTELLEALLSNGRTAEFLIMRNELSQKLESLQKTDIPALPSSLFRCVKFLSAEPGSKEQLGRLCLLSVGSDDSNDQSDDDLKDQSDVESILSGGLSVSGKHTELLERCDTGYATENFSDSLASSECCDNHYNDSVNMDNNAINNVMDNCEIKSDSTQSNVTMRLDESPESNDSRIAEKQNIFNDLDLQKISQNKKVNKLNCIDTEDYVMDSEDVTSSVFYSSSPRQAKQRIKSPRSYTAIRYQILGEQAAPPPPLMTCRKTQTDRPLTSNSYTEPELPLIYHQQTNTETIDTADRSTLTTYQTTAERATTTAGLVVLADQETSTIPPVFVNSSTVTERPKFRPASTQAGGLHDQANKGVMTRRVLLLERETNTPTVATYDCEVMVYIKGEDKAVNTKTIVTVETGCGDYRPLNYRSNSQESSEYLDIVSANTNLSRNIESNETNNEESIRVSIRDHYINEDTLRHLEFCNNIDDTTLLRYFQKRFKHLQIVKVNNLNAKLHQGEIASSAEIIRRETQEEAYAERLNFPGLFSAAGQKSFCMNFSQEHWLREKNTLEEFTSGNEKILNSGTSDTSKPIQYQRKASGEENVNRTEVVKANECEIDTGNENKNLDGDIYTNDNLSERNVDTEYQINTFADYNNLNHACDINSDKNNLSLTKSSSSIFSSFSASGVTSPSTSAFASCASSNSNLESLGGQLDGDLEEAINRMMPSGESEGYENILDLPIVIRCGEKSVEILPHTEIDGQETQVIDEDKCGEPRAESCRQQLNLIDNSRVATQSRDLGGPMTRNYTSASTSTGVVDLNRNDFNSESSVLNDVGSFSMTHEGGQRFIAHQIINLLSNLVIFVNSMDDSCMTAENKSIMKKICFLASESLQRSKLLREHYNTDTNSISEDTQKRSIVKDNTIISQHNETDNDNISPTEVLHTESTVLHNKSSACDASTEYDRVPLMHQSSNTEQLFKVDVGIETRPVVLTDSSTSTSRVSLLHKETCTPIVTRVHKNVATLENVMVDKATSMSSSAAAAYLQEANSRRSITTAVSRGTCTITPSRRDEQTVVIPGELEGTCDRACSPVRQLKVDKAVMATKGAALEPVDKYQAAGKQQMTKLLRPFVDSEKRLGCISESVTEEGEEEEDEAHSPSPVVPLSERQLPDTSGGRHLSARYLNRFKLEPPNSPRPIKPISASETRFSFEGLQVGGKSKSEMLFNQRRQNNNLSLPASDLVEDEDE